MYSLSLKQQLDIFIMKKFQIYKVKFDLLEAMGIYEATTPQEAVNKMATNVVLSEKELQTNYLAIPIAHVQKKYKPTV